MARPAKNEAKPVAASPADNAPLIAGLDQPISAAIGPAITAKA
jgi:hypothetical protein